MKHRRSLARLLGFVAASAVGGCFILIDPTEYDTGIGREGGAGAPFDFDDLDDGASSSSDAKVDRAEAAASEDASDAGEDAKDAEDEFG